MSPLTYVKLALVAGACTIIVGFIWHMSRLESKLEQAQQDLVILERNEVELKEALATQSETLKTKELEYVTIVKLSSDLRSIASTQAREVKELNDKLNVKANGQSRDLGELARAKPAMVQGIVNRATDDVNRCFEVLTGATVKEGEVNNECKDLVKRSSS
jgi:ABC-type anion transport system duplicated permease subunit